MIKFFRLLKHHFAKQNQMSSGHLVEITACGHDRIYKRSYEKVF